MQLHLATNTARLGFCLFIYTSGTLKQENLVLLGIIVAKLTSLFLNTSDLVQQLPYSAETHCKIFSPKLLER